MKILVTGTTGGIGGAVAKAAREAGHEVIEFNRADFVALSNSAPHFENLGAIVFSTGMCPVRPLSRIDDALFAETFRVNCGLFLSLMRAIVAGRMYSPDGMRVVAVSSVSAVEGWAGGAAYCASKGALSALCRALDVELSPRRISVVAVEPRHVATKMFFEGAGRMGIGADSAVPPEELAAEILNIVA